MLLELGEEKKLTLMENTLGRESATGEEFKRRDLTSFNGGTKRQMDSSQLREHDNIPVLVMATSKTQRRLNCTWR